MFLHIDKKVYVKHKILFVSIINLQFKFTTVT